jgi:hypothetical protein
MTRQSAPPAPALMPIIVSVLSPPALSRRGWHCERMMGPLVKLGAGLSMSAADRWPIALARHSIEARAHGDDLVSPRVPIASG